MNSILTNWLAQGESWASAVEFGIPRDEWVNYSVLQRDDDLYTAAFARVFDALRLPEATARIQELASLADALLLFVCSPTSRHVPGVDHGLGRLHAAACAYLAEYAATAELLARHAPSIEHEREEEQFLRMFLMRDLRDGDRNGIVALLQSYVSTQAPDAIDYLEDALVKKRRIGLRSDPRKFIAASLALACVQRFRDVNVWSALRSGTPEYAPDQWQQFFTSASRIGYPLWEVFPSQMEALRKGFLESPPAFSMQMPTSSGKTALCELLIYQEVVIRGGSVLFLVPFRALAAEVQRGLARRLSAAGVSVMASFGGNVPTRSEADSVSTSSVLITTPEKYLALEHIEDAAVKRFSLVICDEGHLIDDGERGLDYELLLTRLRSDESAQARRFVFLSAIIPNIESMHRWLGGDETHVARSNYRPVRVDYSLVVEESRTFDLHVNPHLRKPHKYFLKRFIIRADAQFKNPDTGRLNTVARWNSPSSLACLAGLKASGTGAVAIFTTTRGGQGVAGLTNALLRMLESKVRAASDLQNIEPDAELTEFSSFLLGQQHPLTRLTEQACAIHHGRLPQELRRAVEEKVEKGKTRIVICTNTLAEGVNLPIRTIIIHTARRFNEASGGLRYIERRTVKNIVGRAGRAGKERRGRVIFVNEREKHFSLQVMRDASMEKATGLLFRLVQAIHSYLTQHGRQLDESLFDMDDEWLQERLDEIDYALLELLPTLEHVEAGGGEIVAILDRTLALAQDPPDEIRQCLHDLFRLRAVWLQSRVDPAQWEVLQMSGIPPRLYQKVDAIGCLAHPLWLDLSDSLDETWLDEVILPLLAASGGDGIDSSLAKGVIRGWMSGGTYKEVAETCGVSVDEILDILTGTVGFHLQHVVSKVCQLAAQHLTGISDVALRWASLLQFGVRTLQQLDLMEHGFTDRLAIWGISRYLQSVGFQNRRHLMSVWIREHSATIAHRLRADPRVPEYCVNVFEKEL